MKCRMHLCHSEAMPGDPRCGFHKELYDERTEKAKRELRELREAAERTKQKGRAA